MGTPAYMAPEQLDGHPAGPAADQFAFCASLWEALTGRRPFDGHDVRTLRAAIESGPPPSGLRGWQRAVLDVATRGLSVDPAARFPSLTACLEALQGAAGDHRFDLEVGRRQRRLMLGVIAACGVAVEVGFVTDTLPYPKTATELLPLGVATLLIMGVVTRALWRTLAATDVNRRIGLVTLGASVITLVNRLAGARFDAPPAMVLATDLLCIGALCVGVTTRHTRWFGTAAAVQLVGAMCCALVPGAAAHVFTADVLTTGALMAWYWER